MYGTQGNIGTIVTAGTDNAPFRIFRVPVPAIFRVWKMEKCAGYLDMSEICVNTHTHTHILTVASRALYYFFSRRYARAGTPFFGSFLPFLRAGERAGTFRAGTVPAYTDLIPGIQSLVSGISTYS